MWSRPHLEEHIPFKYTIALSSSSMKISFLPRHSGPSPLTNSPHSQTNFLPLEPCGILPQWPREMVCINSSYLYASRFLPYLLHFQTSAYHKLVLLLSLTSVASAENFQAYSSRDVDVQEVLMYMRPSFNSYQYADPIHQNHKVSPYPSSSLLMNYFKPNPNTTCTKFNRHL